MPGYGSVRKQLSQTLGDEEAPKGLSAWMTTESWSGDAWKTSNEQAAMITRGVVDETFATRCMSRP
jgi:hypothetical protein